jgi:hypothetical protein
METTIHGTDIGIAKSAKERPVVDRPNTVECASEPDADGASGDLNDGPTWLDGPPLNLTNIERHQFSVAKHIDITFAIPLGYIS